MIDDNILIFPFANYASRMSQIEIHLQWVGIVTLALERERKWESTNESVILRDSRFFSRKIISFIIALYYGELHITAGRMMEM